MTVRCELNINGGTRRILLVAKEEETADAEQLELLEDKKAAKKTSK